MGQNESCCTRYTSQQKISEIISANMEIERERVSTFKESMTTNEDSKSRE